MEPTFNRTDPRSVLRAKAWGAARKQTESLLSAALPAGDLARLATEAEQLAEKALASVAPRVIEDPKALGWPMPDCQAGCHYCCYEQVNVTPPEVFAVVDHIKANWSDGKRQSVRKKLRLAAEKSRDLDHDGYFAARIPCPLLNAEGRCSAYKVRPLMCRAYNSLDVKACEQAAKHAHRSAHERGVRTNGTIHGIMDGVFGGLQEALRKAGLQDFLPNLTAALHQALDKPGLRSEWLAGKRAFR